MPKSHGDPNRGPGRPPNGSRVIGVRVHGVLADKIAKAAKRGRKKESAVLRDLAEEHLR